RAGAIRGNAGACAPGARHRHCGHSLAGRSADDGRRGSSFCLAKLVTNSCYALAEGRPLGAVALLGTPPSFQSCPRKGHALAASPLATESASETLAIPVLCGTPPSWRHLGLVIGQNTGSGA